MVSAIGCMDRIFNVQYTIVDAALPFGVCPAMEWVELQHKIDMHTAHVETVYESYFSDYTCRIDNQFVIVAITFQP